MERQYPFSDRIGDILDLGDPVFFAIDGHHGLGDWHDRQRALEQTDHGIAIYGEATGSQRPSIARRELGRHEGIALVGAGMPVEAELQIGTTLRQRSDGERIHGKKWEGERLKGGRSEAGFLESFFQDGLCAPGGGGSFGFHAGEQLLVLGVEFLEVLLEDCRRDPRAGGELGVERLDFFKCCHRSWYDGLKKEAPRGHVVISRCFLSCSGELRGW